MYSLGPSLRLPSATTALWDIGRQGPKRGRVQASCKKNFMREFRPFYFFISETS